MFEASLKAEQDLTLRAFPGGVAGAVFAAILCSAFLPSLQAIDKIIPMLAAAGVGFPFGMLALKNFLSNKPTAKDPVTFLPESLQSHHQALTRARQVLLTARQSGELSGKWYNKPFSVGQSNGRVHYALSPDALQASVAITAGTLMVNGGIYLNNSSQLENPQPETSQADAPASQVALADA